MASLTRAEREEVARRRIINVLKAHGIAGARTLEQKISDAGPNPQRVDPHILTTVRNRMLQEGRIASQRAENMNWFYLPETPPHIVAQRLDEQASVAKALHKRSLSVRMGQTLEIATYKALLELDEEYPFFGSFTDLDEHADDKNYSKEEPPRHIRKRVLKNKQNLDFIVHHPTAGYMGIECKNIREWLYPAREEVIETLAKCLTLGCIPVIIARRIPYVTFSLLSTCGVIVHQTYNQLFPESDKELTDKAKHKKNLGYHDIRNGNDPDARMIKFITDNMVSVAENSVVQLREYKDLLEGFAFGQMPQDEFARRVVARRRGFPEIDPDFNPFEPDPADWDYDE